MWIPGQMRSVCDDADSPLVIRWWMLPTRPAAGLFDRRGPNHGFNTIAFKLPVTLKVPFTRLELERSST